MYVAPFNFRFDLNGVFPHNNLHDRDRDLYDPLALFAIACAAMVQFVGQMNKDVSLILVLP